MSHNLKLLNYLEEKLEDYKRNGQSLVVSKFREAINKIRSYNKYISSAQDLKSKIEDLNPNVISAVDLFFKENMKRTISPKISLESKYSSPSFPITTSKIIPSDVNKDIIEGLEKIRDERLREGKEKPAIAYENGIKAIIKYGRQINSGAQAQEIRGIGPAISKSIDEILGSKARPPSPTGLKRGNSPLIFSNVLNVGRPSSPALNRPVSPPSVLPPIPSSLPPISPVGEYKPTVNKVTGEINKDPSNREIIEVLKGLERENALKGDTHRATAYKNAVENISHLHQPIISGKFAKENIKGVGDKIAARIESILTGEYTSELTIPKDELRIIREFMEIWGVGDVTAKKWYKMGARTIADLRYVDLNTTQKAGYKYYNHLKVPIPREEVMKIGNYVKSFLPEESFFGLYGSYIRGEPFSSDVDVLVTDVDLPDLVVKLQKAGLLFEVPSLGTDKIMGICKYYNIYRRIDIYRTTKEHLPTFTLHLTGPRQFNTNLRAIAAKKGMRLNEYGLFQDSIPIPVQSEEDVFNILGVEYVVPEKRS